MNCTVIPESPSGYRLEEAVLTTFDLDMDTLQDLIGTDRDPERFIVFRGDGDLVDSSEADPCPGTLRDLVVKVAWPVPEAGIPEAFFHAKVWLFEYRNASGGIIWRLIVQSANISSYDNLETVLHFTGSDEAAAVPETAPLRSFYSGFLPFITDDSAHAEKKRRRISDLIRRLETVRFTPCAPSGADIIQRTAYFCRSFSFIGPFCKGAPFLQEACDEILVISPVITAARLSALTEKVSPGGRCVVMTNASSAVRLLSAGEQCVQWLLPRAQDPFVHAKLFLIRRGPVWELYCGSMNLTEYAMDRNMEFMTCLKAPGSITSIEAFLAEFTGRDLTEITEELSQYAADPANFPAWDSTVFRQAAHIKTRTGYAAHLIQRQKYSEEESGQIISFLLSAQCVSELGRLLHDPELPSIPLRKTVMVSQKERAIFALPDREMLLLGLLNHALHQYDYLFSENVFLHVRGRGPADVFAKIRNDNDFSALFLFKTDIHDFDPSMDAGILSTSVHRLFSFDNELCGFLDRFIYRKEYRLGPGAELFTDGPAQKTGLPLCGFFENVYLQDFDEQMERDAAFYVRCGDDMLIGATTREEIDALAGKTRSALSEKQLSLSENKTLVLEPGKEFVFLGWNISGRRIDFSAEALGEIEQSIRKITKHLLIRYKQAGIPPALRLPLLIKYVKRSLNGSRIIAAFRIVTVTDGLQKIDRMICDAIRTVATEKTGKSKYRLSYKMIQAWGYRSLVNQYYRRINSK